MRRDSPKQLPKIHSSLMAVTCPKSPQRAGWLEKVKFMQMFFQSSGFGSVPVANIGHGELGRGTVMQAVPPCSLTFLSFFNTHIFPNESSLEWLPGLQLHQLPAQPLQLSKHCWEWETLGMEKHHAWEKPCTPPPLLAASSTDRSELNGVSSIK